MLNVGDKIYVPGYGAGIVTLVQNKEICGCMKKYIGISLMIGDINLYIPDSELEKYNLRYIISKEDSEKSLKTINTLPKFIEKKWGRRYRQNNEKIRNGDFGEICEVLRDLYYLKSKELMPPGEQKILEQAEKMIVSELMLVYDISREESYNKLKTFSE